MANRGTGFSYARGPVPQHAMGKPASAFSAGNVLEFDSSSSLSATNLTLANNFVGIALTDSDKSDINGNVPYMVLRPDTIWWASTATNVATAYAEGDSFDFIASDGNHIVQSSATTARVVVAQGGAQRSISQSDQSRIQVYFLGSGTELEYA